ncbi:MAG: tetratricopeptide repeat protein [Candidatus Altiarchaeota archaeon]
MDDEEAPEYELHNLANDYYKLGDFMKAIEHYTKAISLKPDMIESYFNRGLAYTRINDFRKALDDHTRVIELKPDLAEVYYTRGLMHEYLKDYDSAVRDYSRAVELNPSYTEAREQKAIALRKKTNT